MLIFSELKIELDIFSGVVNPSWILTNESANFNGLIGILAGTPSTPLPSRLGYRGFNVRFLLNDGTYVYQTFGYGGQAASTIETVLLNSHDGVLSSEVLSIAAAAIHDLVSMRGSKSFVIGGPTLTFVLVVGMERGWKCH